MILTNAMRLRFTTIIEPSKTARELDDEKNSIRIFLMPFCSRCHQQCINTIGSFKCECFPGFMFNENELCIDIDECKLGKRCPKSSQCINTAGSYSCICPTGMKLSKDMNDCIEIKNECKALIVKNGSARCTRSR